MTLISLHDVVQKIKDEASELCLDLQLISDIEYKKLLQYSVNTGHSLFDLIHSDGYINDRDLAYKISKKYGLEVASHPKLFNSKNNDLPFKFFLQNG